VRGLLMRGTVHTVASRDFALFSAALAGEPPGWVTPELEEIADQVAEPLREFCSEPRTRGEVLAWLEHELGVPNDGSNGIWYAIRLRARIAHSAEASRWRAPIHNPTFVALAHDEEDGETARVAIVRRYLAAFGPATRAEISGWSGLKVRRFAHLLDGLVRLRDDRGRELLDLPRAPRPEADTPAPVRLLPKFDNVLLDRERVLPEAYRTLVVRKNADVQPTFTADGYVAGIWRVEKRRVVTEPFEPLPLGDQARAQGRGRSPGCVARVASAACSSAATARAGSRRRSRTRTRSGWTRCSCSSRARAPGASPTTTRPSSRPFAPGGTSSGSARSRSTRST
jgi:hypothetical protein